MKLTICKEGEKSSSYAVEDRLSPFVCLKQKCVSIIDNIIYFIHHHTQCIPLIKNYDQGLGREERQQLIPKKESAPKSPSTQERWNFIQCIRTI